LRSEIGAVTDDVYLSHVCIIHVQNAMLEFERLVKVRHQVVAGTMHHFTVQVKEAGGGKKLYEAKVWEKVWENFKQLQSFQPVGDAAAA